MDGCLAVFRFYFLHINPCLQVSLVAQPVGDNRLRVSLQATRVVLARERELTFSVTLVVGDVRRESAGEFLVQLKKA